MTGKVKSLGRLFLLCIFSVVMLSVPAWADIDSGTYDGVDWRITDDGELIIGNGGEQTFLYRSYRGLGSYPWGNDFDSLVESVRFDGVVNGNGVMGGMFYNLPNMASLDLSGFDTSRVTKLDSMFLDCSSLTSLDLSGFDTSNVMSMNSMFSGCSSLVSIDLSSFDTSNVTDMSQMFSWCNKLTSLDLSGFDTSNVTDMRYMFNRCESLASLDLSGFDTSNVTDMSYMFHYCKVLSSLGLSSFVTSNVTNMQCMFYSCESLLSLDLSGFDTSNVIYMSSMFRDLTNLEEIYLSENFEFKSSYNDLQVYKSAKDITGKWVRDDGAYGPYSGDELIENYSSEMSGHWVLERVKTATFNSGNNVNYKMLILVNQDPTKIISFSRSPSSPPVDAETVDLSDSVYKTLPIYAWIEGGNIKWFSEAETVYFSPNNGASYFFDGFTNLESVDLTGVDCSLMNGTAKMFRNCESLVYLDLSCLDTSEVTSWSDMFEGCTSLEELNISSFDTSSAYSLNLKLDTCTKLSKIHLGENLSFQSRSNLLLPIPPSDSTSGKWVREDGVYGPYTSSELIYAYTPEMAGTWVWQEKQVKFTVEYQATGNDISGSMISSEFSNEEDNAISKNSFYKFKYKFVNWSGSDGNTYEDGEVITAGTIEAGTTLVLTANFEPIDTSVDITDGEFEVTLRGGEKATFSDLPANTSYQIWEETSSGWRLIDESGTSGKILSNSTSDAYFINKYAPGETELQLVGLKLLDGKAADSGSFSFDLFEDGELLYEGVANGEGGVIRFPPITYTSPGYHIYKVTEEVGNDSNIEYDDHEEVITVLVGDKGDGNLYANVSMDNDGIVFRNTSKVIPSENDERPGSLKLTKLVEQGSSTREFTFEVTLTDKYGRSLSSETLSAIANTGNFAEVSDGKILVTMVKDREEVLSGIPKGAVYSVREVNIPDGWIMVSEVGAVGSIVPNTTSEVSIKNTYSASGFVSLGAYKSANFDFSSGDFSFTLSEGDTVLQTVTNSTPSEEVDGLAPIRFDDIVYTEEGTHVYTIREVPGDRADVAYDSHILTATVTISDNGRGILNTTVSYSEDQTFTNTLKPVVEENPEKTGSLSVSKTVRNAAMSGRAFTFTISLKDINGTSVTGEFPIDVAGTPDVISDGGSFELHDGEMALISDLPEGVVYEVVETETAGYVCSKSGDSGVITTDFVSEATFENTYSAFGDITLKATKVFSDPIEEEQFKFNLYDELGHQIASAYAKPDGSIIFPSINFVIEDIGVHTFSIVEETGDDGTIQYDAHTEDVTVTVEDHGDGTLNVVAEYSTPEGAVFTNRRNYTVTFIKVGPEGEEITDARLQVLDENEQMVNEWTTMAGYPRKLNLGKGTYTLRELSAPDPYGIAEDLTFEVTEDGRVKVGENYMDAVIMEDPYGTHEIPIIKRNVKGNTVSGIKLKVTGKGDTDITDIEPIEWMSREEAEVLSLNAGNYTLTEVEAKTGYAAADPINFTVKQDGTIEVGGQIVDTVTMIDDYEKHNLTVTKTVTGNMGDRTKEFDFTLKLTKGSLADLPATLSYKKNDEIEVATLTNGTYDFKLANGEQIIFYDIPYDTLYEVKETVDLNLGYRVTKTGDTGKITTEDKAATFTNHRDSGIPTAADTNMLLAIFLSVIGMICLVLTKVLHQKGRKQE